MKIRSLLFILSTMVMVFKSQAQNQSQSDIAPVSTTYYLQNCNIIPQPGTLLSGYSILLKKGKIAQVGKNINIPFDAMIIKLDSMYVYAGFIDAYSNTGSQKPESKGKQNISDPGNPPNDAANITPQNRATDQYKSSVSTVSEMRSQGFGLTNAVPQGQYLPGYSDLLLLGNESTYKMLFKPNTAQHIRLNPTRGVYPSTIMGAMAKFRDLYRNANITGKHNEQYNTKSGELTRPDYSEELKALYPVTTGKIPLFFYTAYPKDIYRAYILKEELGFDLVLTEVKQGWHYVDKIKKSNTKILLSLDLPEQIKKDSSIIQDDIINYEEKRSDAVNESFGQAALFEKEGISFGFSFMDVKPKDIQKNIQLLVKNKLSEQSALAALTTYPARLLGISQMAGTVEPGKIANLVITDKPYFDEKSAIKYVFVDGVKYEYYKKNNRQPGNKDTKGEQNYEGIWSYTVDVAGNTQQGKLKIFRKDGQYNLTVQNESDGNTVIHADNVSIEGNQLTFNITVAMGQDIKINFDLNMQEKSFSGSADVGEFGSFPVKGTFISKPE
ncbi:MAG TPA: amidohydrolase family protein [Saprospiraceae bacterium]|nr:amidohydrolase family protein [Saprospiraceae bacterium]HRO72898.1 amidohydrolase family protein [Saprospiraceae bacterium]HRP42979.1 amidohydrolase family protein [Saprospiraceae bacterium]